ncbi:hypothetical protein PaG_02934 [Moesziomyces aphidis]|uniref:Uncharacterized protein n=2 Tax=Moesziomyces TaxID=63261 RepID=M9LSI4_PSEA3|nr:hypothetical protein PaG_02934 [Moesziomyces aphidis]GAC76916.1 hypothetical protein PANT_22d00253 [Moesziomyces antarcticus T-34]
MHAVAAPCLEPRPLALLPAARASCVPCPASPASPASATARGAWSRPKRRRLVSTPPPSTSISISSAQPQNTQASQAAVSPPRYPKPRLRSWTPFLHLVLRLA